jgi:hypothetical protein
LSFWAGGRGFGHSIGGKSVCTIWMEVCAEAWHWWKLVPMLFVHSPFFLILQANRYNWEVFNNGFKDTFESLLPANYFSGCWVLTVKHIS